ncbi:MAG TPA: hypothetical protein VHH34_17445 [Pseudonocardiaceae bacterium]|nr:hypothetical protein [Pseudonocardiaceae bacterium]
MSDTQSRVSAATGTGASTQPEVTPEPGRWVGWVLFAGSMMIILGTFQVLAGLAALFNDGYYIVTSNDLLISVDYTAWGWVHLVIGVLILAASFGILAGQAWARLVGIVFAGLSAIINLGFLAAFPVWSVVMIALDIIVIYGLSMHGREVQI